MTVADAAPAKAAADERKMMKTEAKATGTDLQVYDYGEDAGAGVQDVGKDEYTIPLLRRLQALSPQCKPVSQGGTEGAEQGMILNTATGQLFKASPAIPFVPVHRDHNYVEYVPRDAGGGFVGIRSIDDSLVLRLRAEQGQFGKLQTSDGTEITETYYLYGILMPDPDTLMYCIVPFSSSAIKKYKSFMTRVMGITYRVNKGNEANPLWSQITPPLWAHEWTLETVFEKNKKGEFYNWSLALKSEPPISARLRLNDPVYQAGKEFYQLIQAGKMRADFAKAEPGADEADDMPF